MRAVRGQPRQYALGMMSRPRLIVNADDFGLSAEVNEAVVLAFRRGVLTSCSLMATGPAFNHAVRLAEENEGLSVGIHLVAALDRPVLSPARIPALVNRHGNFRSDPTLAGLKYFFCRAARRQLKDELRAQFERFVSTGLVPSHVDSHLHLHMHPVMFDAAVELAAEYGVPGMRVPSDDLRMVRDFDGRKSLGRSVQDTVFRMLCNRMRRILTTRGIVFPEKVFGCFMTGKMSEKYVLHVLQHMDSGMYEMYFHPALYRAEQLCHTAAEQGRREYEILVSEQVRAALRARDIVLTNYEGLEPNQ